MAAHGIMRVSASVVASRPHRVCALVWRAAFLRGKTRTVYTPIPNPCGSQRVTPPPKHIAVRMAQPVTFFEHGVHSQEAY